MGAGVVALCFVVVVLQLAMGSNMYISGDDYGSEPENIVTIHTAEPTVDAGASYTLNCTVAPQFRPVVKWIDPDGNPVNSSGITMDEPVYHGNKTYLILRFHSVRTSQAGRYTCQSTVSSHLPVETATTDLVVTVPVPSVRIIRTPSSVVYTISRLILNCITVLNLEVDTLMTVTHSWRGPSGSISPFSSRPRVYNVTRLGQVYRSTILFSSGTRSSDSGTYYCTASTRSASSSPYIASSDSVSVSTSISIEPENIVTIHTAEPTVDAGASYTLNCTVVSHFHPVVNWIDPDGNPVNSSGITMDEPVYHGNKTYLILRFHSVRTSQAGRYTCQSTVSSHLSVKTATTDLVVTVPVPSVHIIHTPSTDVYTTSLLNLTCITELNPEVDTPTTATHLWQGPSGNISSYSSHPRVYNVTQVGQVYRSTILFSSGLQSSDSGTYYCTASTHSASSSPHIASSDSVSVSTSISIALQVVIDVSYTAPEPGYQPPYYRAASAVTLTCRAVGGTGQIRYRWTSTCRSGCFVPYAGGYEYSYGAVTRSRDFLRIHDAGTHTCSAYEERHGISGSASTVMSVIGAGIHETHSELSYSSSSLPNNSIILADGTRYSYYSRPRRMGFYCCSSSTSAGTYGTFIGLNSVAYSGRIIISRQSSSSSNAGCMRVYFDKLYRTYYQNNLETYEQGIYTCRLPDATGRNTDVSVGIYREGYSAVPTITSFQIVRSTTHFTLTCTSTNSPATMVTWMRDGDMLPIDGVKNQFYQAVTSRRNSTYQNTLVVDDIENLPGNYTCNVNNKFGSSSQRLTVRGLHISPIRMPLTVGDTVSIMCSTDLDVTTIEWIRDNITVVNSSSQSLTLQLDPVSVDHHNTQYTCRVTSPYGIQEETVDITVQIPQSWATVHISSPPDDSAVMGRELVMTCTVTAARGLTVVPSVTWTGPDGNLNDVENITVGPAQIFGLVTSRSLTLHHLQLSDRGKYVCKAAISIPRLETSLHMSAHEQLDVIEVDSMVTIYTAESTMFAGASYTLNCTVVSDFRPVVKWINPLGNPVNGSGIAIDEPVYHDKNTYVLLKFSALRTSQAGLYTCQSEIVRTQLSVKTATKYVMVVGLHISPIRMPLTVGDTVSIMCSTDLDVTTIEWIRDDIAVANSRSQSLTLLLDPVSVDHHNTQYTCRVTSPYGTQEETVDITVAMEIHGHEEPIIVGQTGKIRCSTHLNATRIEWFYAGVTEPVEKSYNQHVTLVFDAKNMSLNGTMLKCRVTDVRGDQYEESVTVLVKEPEYIVTIHTAESTVFAGASYTLNCTVFYQSSPRPVVKWMGIDGDPLDVNQTHGDMIIDEPVHVGNTMYVLLRFASLRTSQAGQYTCQSTVSSPLSVRTATRNVIVTIPAPRVLVIRTPSTRRVYTATPPFNLTCITVLNPEVDTPMTVTHSWRGPSGSIYPNSSHPSVNSSRPSVYNVTQVGHVYRSTVLFGSGLQSTVSGSYYCTADISSTSSYIIVTNGSVEASTHVYVGQRTLQVVIDISYTPPEPGYQPPYYRAASPVTLTCRAVGGVGQIRYRWTSTCRSGCFVPYSGWYEYSYGAVTRSRDFLRIRDNGNHTCSAYEERSHGNSGSASTVVNVIGAGIYVTDSELSYSSQSLPNNSIIVADATSYPSYNTRTPRRMGFYCCSNSTSAGTNGTFIGLNSVAYSGRIIISRQNSYDGCMYLHFDKPNYYLQNTLETSEQGIYTCRMPDATGTNVDISVGIYNEYGYSGAPSITSFQYASSATNLTLICTSTNSPATDVTWLRDGETLMIDGVKNQFYQTVTSRPHSTYQNTLIIIDAVENTTGTYTCNVTNAFGSSNSDLTLRGFQIGFIQTPLNINDTVSIVCTTDVAFTTIEWITAGVTVDRVTSDNSNKQSLALLLDPVSPNHHNTQYTCRVTSPHGTQEEKTVDITVQIPQSWATVQISSPPDDHAIVGREFVMTCTVTVVRGLAVVPSVTWTGPDGNLTDAENITVGPAQTFDLVTSRSLTLRHLQSPEGGQYSCNAAISVPGFEIPPQRSANKQLAVISQALFQLKFGPVEHCVHWDPAESRATTLDSIVREALAGVIRERCSCDFQSTSIERGEFSCRTTTTHVIYRSTINSTSDVQTAPKLLDFIEDWLKNEGMFLAGSFRLRAVPDCPLQIQSFYQPECMNGESTNKQNLNVVGPCE